MAANTYHYVSLLIGFINLIYYFQEQHTGSILHLLLFLYSGLNVITRFTFVALRVFEISITLIVQSVFRKKVSRAIDKHLDILL